ncbi:MAG: hypothetical protein ACOCUU_01980 [Nanoarchaeota archaeon]
MEIKQILYIDDSLENGATALAVDSRVDYVSDPSLIEMPLRDYDCIITDMQMKDEKSGLEVVENSIREGKLPWVVTGGTYQHGGTFNRVRLYNAVESRIFNKLSKSDRKFWEEVIPFIDENNENATQKALQKVHSVLGVTPPGTLDMLMRFYREQQKEK